MNIFYMEQVFSSYSIFYLKFTWCSHMRISFLVFTCQLCWRFRNMNTYTHMCVWEGGGHHGYVSTTTMWKNKNEFTWRKSESDPSVTLMFLGPPTKYIISRVSNKIIAKKVLNRANFNFLHVLIMFKEIHTEWVLHISAPGHPL